MDLTEYLLPVSGEVQLFLGSIVLGMPLGMLFDCFRLLRAAIPHHAVIIFAEDMLFMLLSALMLECYGVMCAGGAVRWYFAAGALTGFLLYLVTVGMVTGCLMRRLRRITVKTLSALRRNSRRIVKFIYSRFMKYRKNCQDIEKMTENT